MADSTPRSYATDPTLYLYTSLSSGSSHIVTATSRLETILKANKIPFRALDVATDEKARMLWGRRAGKRSLPGLVRLGMVVGDLEEVEEWNEYGEIKEQLAPPLAAGKSTPATSSANTPSKAGAGASNPAVGPPAASQDSTPSKVAPTPAPAGLAAGDANKAKAAPEPDAAKGSAASGQNPMALTMRQLGTEAAEKAKEAKAKAAAALKESVKAQESSSKKAGHEDAEKDIKPDQAAPSGVTMDASKTEASDRSDVYEPSKSGEAASAAEVPARSTAESNSASPSAQAVESTDALVASTSKGSVTQHRGSSVSAVDKETAQSIEAASKIDEDPEAEAAEPVKDAALGDAVAPAASQRASSVAAADADTVKSIESATKIDEEPAVEAAAAAPTSRGLETSAAAKNDGEQHVKFEGERPGKEIDKVKATLATGTGTKLDGSVRPASAERPASASETSKGVASTAGPVPKDEDQDRSLAAKGVEEPAEST